ncbi:WD40-repeat-containing domain protein [Neocallimastix lanati (nom. inval.)]|jgi:dynein intermediate chain 2|nr:WD40-repeat-containing domain protein [Neocallimastix sp. JGI-2020a]
MEIVYVYQKKRNEFGKQPLFKDKPAWQSVDIAPDPSYMENYTEKKYCSVECQCVPEQSEHEVNTESLSFSNQGILHLQGGWPKDVDPSDVEHTIRFRKKIEKDEEYIKVIKNLGDSMEQCIKQNNAIDIYEEYFKEEIESEPPVVEPPSIKTYNVYRDPNAIKRAATCVSWYPDDNHKIAVAYSILQFQKMPYNMCLDSYIWDIENPNVIDQTITPSSPLVTLKYNPKDPHILIGGSYNGLVSYWDLRKGQYPVDTSLIEKSHNDPVFGLSWIQSKSGSEFFSVSTDGKCLWWDIRKLSEPTETLMIDAEKNGKIVGGTTIDFESTMPTKFMIGTETGNILICNKKGKTPAEKIVHNYPAHLGPIYSLRRNPFFLKNFLTIGDWSAKIWSEDVKYPLLISKNSTPYLTDGCWSTSRPSVLYTTKMDGSIDVWDLLLQQNDPILTFQVCNAPIHTIQAQDQGKMLAVGARDGTTTLLGLSESLINIQNNEKKVFSEMLEREGKREKALESALREKRVKQLKKAEALPEPSAETIEELITQAQNEFYETIENEQK